jgi:hypothetical protein
MMGGLKKNGCSKTNIKTMSFFFVRGSTLLPPLPKKKNPQWVEIDFKTNFLKPSFLFYSMLKYFCIIFFIFSFYCFQKNLSFYFNMYIWPFETIFFILVCI